MQVTSAPDLGTKVWITLPILRVEDVADPGEAQSV